MEELRDGIEQTPIAANVQAKPAKIKLAAGNNTLTIEWTDGHLSVYPYRYLRHKCPCATCTDATGHRDPGESSANPLPILDAKPLRPERAELVGRYALQIHWSDGHSTGLYGFNYLRELCQCETCAAQNGGQ